LAAEIQYNDYFLIFQLCFHCHLRHPIFYLKSADFNLGFQEHLPTIKKSRNPPPLNEIGKQNSSSVGTKRTCLHSQIISGDLVDTFEPYYRGYMKDYSI